MLLELLSGRNSFVADLAFRLREVILDEAPGVTEMVHDVKYCIALNYTFTKSVKQAFCGVAIYQRYMNMGLYRGVELHDPKKLLLGNGKLHRHLKFQTYQDAERPHVRTFLQQAIAIAKREAAAMPVKPAPDKKKR